MVTYAIFFLILLISIGLRGQEAFSQNYLFLLDQGRDMMAVKQILYDNHLTLIGPNTSLQGVFQGPLWYYLLALPTFFFQGDPLGGVVLMLSISMAVIIVAYIWISKLFNEQAAVITAFLFATSPQAIAAATFSWNPHPMWLLITIYIFSFYEVTIGKKMFHLLLWPVIGFMSHFQTALTIFIFAATILYLVIFIRNYFLNKQFFIGIFLCSIFFLPQVVFELRHDLLMTKSVISVLKGANQGLSAGSETSDYYSAAKEHIDAFYTNFKSSFVFEQFPSFLFLSMIVFFIVVVISNKKIHFLKIEEYNFVLQTFVIICMIIGLSFLYPFPIRSWFLTGFQAFYIVSFSLCLSKFWNYRIGGALLYFIFFLTAVFLMQKIYFLYTKPDYGGVAKIKGKIDAIDYIYKDANGKDFGLLIFAPPVYTPNYDYLIWWHGKGRYGYIPKQSKDGIFYLLIEPDSSKRWSYNGWLETVVKTGEILETKELPSGHIVEKRFQKNEI